MKTNQENILYLVSLIEEDLSMSHNLDSLAKTVGYSKYHLHKMFTNVVGMSLYQYIKRRRLSEAAKKLLCTEDSIINIALDAGYESQQAFTDAFRSTFSLSPRAFRYKMHQLSLIPRYEHTPKMKGDRIMDVRLEDSNEIILVGFSINTMKGFFLIPRVWKKLHKTKNKVANRISKEWVYGINDYEKAKQTDKNLAFDYLACIEVSKKDNIDNGMIIKELPKSHYVVFSLRANPQESLESTIDYIYKEWFPSSTYQLNDKARYDFVKYGEEFDSQGIADIEVWVPII